jgi:hypothetical protein
MYKKNLDIATLLVLSSSNELVVTPSSVGLKLQMICVSETECWF